MIEYYYSPMTCDDVIRIALEMGCKDIGVKRMVTSEEIQEIRKSGRFDDKGYPVDLFVELKEGYVPGMRFDGKHVRFENSQHGKEFAKILESYKEQNHEGYSCVKELFKKLCSFVVVVAILPLMAMTEVVDGIEWSWSDSYEQYSGIANYVGQTPVNVMGDKYVAKPPFRSVVREDIEGVVEIPEVLGASSVEEVGPFAFYNCTNISCVVFPSSVKTVNPLSFCYGDCLRGVYGYSFTYDYVWCTPCIKDVYFMGDCPSVYGFSTPHAGIYSSEGAHGWWQRSAGMTWSGEYYWFLYCLPKDTEMLSGATCWVNYGTKGWTQSTWQGATVKYGPTSISASPSNGYTTSVRLTAGYASAEIYYTLDGSEPKPIVSDGCNKYTKGQVIALPDRLTRLRAISYVPGCPYIPSVDNVYNEQGTLSLPTFKHECEEEYFESGQLVEILSNDEGTVIRYTLDGSPVTEHSTVYDRPIAISTTLTIKAKTFKEEWIPSEEASISFVRKWHKVVKPFFENLEIEFYGVSKPIDLSCEDKDASIYYTLDGSEPSATNGRLYKGPFNVYQTTTVKAIAVKDDWKDSEVVTATFTKANELGPAMNLLEVLPDNDAAHPWTVVTDVTHDGKSAVKSGAIGDEESTTVKAVIYGAGQLSFWWKTACEPAIDGEYYDFATFYNGSTEVARLAGDTNWQRVVLDVPGTGKHTFKWTYQKDDSGSTVPDGVWVDQVQWLPATTDYYSDATLTTEIPVKYEWLHRYGLDAQTDFEAAAMLPTGKTDDSGRPLVAADDFVAGTDPTNGDSRLKALIEIVDGKPKVAWEPDLNEGGSKSIRAYKVWGRVDLNDEAGWVYPADATHKFFKVSVEMP